ncbi:MAG: ATP-dependent DNA ligase [Actinomycetota bacterium]
MTLPLAHPIEPMLAKKTTKLPDGPMVFEPKWDGFRCIAFLDGDEVTLQSRNRRDFNRYFPELLEPLRAALPDRCIVDTELVVPGPNGLDFDALSQRIHPAESRVRMLAETTPAEVVVFDLLAVDDTDLTGHPLHERRALLEAAMAAAEPPIHLSLATADPQLAADWFDRFEGAGLDGVIAKERDGTYRPGERGWLKVKPERTADVVVAGFRIHKDGAGIGSLLLGLYDDDGTLQNVGVASSFTAVRRAELLVELTPIVLDDVGEHPWAAWADAAAHATGRMPGGPSRWNNGKDLSWTPVRTDRVAEVKYTQLEAGRFRHATKLLRWRPDRDPESCRYDQLDVPPPRELSEVFASRRADHIATPPRPSEGDGASSVTPSTGSATGRRSHEST